jgi:hypothetical protein
MDKAEQKIFDDVKKYGVHIMQVFGDDECPEFSYTIGLYKSYKHPEVIIIGLKNELSKILLNNMNDDIKNGKKYLPGQFYNGILDDFPCYFGTASPANEDFPTGFASWYYRGVDFPLLQCVAPTVKGIFPWEDNFPENARFYFPLLVEPPKK